MHRLNADIKTLRAVEAEQCDQIRQAEARLHELQAQSQRREQEEAYLRTEQSRREAEAEIRKQHFQDAVALAKEKIRLLAQEEEQLVKGKLATRKLSQKQDAPKTGRRGAKSRKSS